MMTERISPAEYEDYLRHKKSGAKGPWRSPFANAKPTQVGNIKFPSKTEARVFEALLGYALLYQAQHPGRAMRLYRGVRFPLLNIEANDRRVPLAFTIDFMLVGDGIFIPVDAKSGKRRNREWDRGKRAFEAFYRCRVIEWDGVGKIPESILLSAQGA